MDTKFTPGPWFWHGPINPNRMDYGVTAVRPYDPGIGAARRIAWIGNGASTRIMPDTEANAHLIAAAPDLYAALDMLLYDMDYEAENLAFARRMLAKARGELPSPANSLP